MTDEQRQARRELLYGRSVRELVDMLIEAEEELQEAKELRRRMMQIRNLVLEKEERNRPGRPPKIN